MILNIFFILVSLMFIFDIVMVTTSTAFISRFFSVPIRSILFTLFSFFQLVIAFSILYRLFAHHFKDILISQFQAVYFSFVTITTLGYGDFTPLPEAWHIQLIVIIQLVLGLYFLVIMLSIITNWANMLPVGIPSKELKDILVDGCDLNNGGNIKIPNIKTT
jgi:hypothetical protein